ncbi:EamA family transporter [Pseudoclavibacter sp. CFCC 14310]|uniref:EamA family transporter n=1 Tax=Pseudoclavibacter sp. CFCC 14310 TaxID=2615180 RepID=UPI001300F65E|nr:EamA family transporter [Pseudoclavibacter sp. CFCC 14310]KAB1644546.1 EamA family transporter [Pseudoclavibacter sp. CFCC 14310]
MSLFAIALITVGALAHAAWNLISKRAAAGGVAFLLVGALASTLVWAPVAVWTLVVTPTSWTALFVGSVVSALLHIGYMLLLQHGYRVGDISVVYPTARGSGPLLSVIFAIVLFGERPGASALIGVALIITGVLFIGLSDLRTTNAARTRVGVVFGTLTGVTIAIYTIWDAHMVNGAGVPPVALMVGCSLGESIAFLWMLLGRRPSRPARSADASSTSDAGRLSALAGGMRDRLRGQADDARRQVAETVRSSWRPALVFGVLSPLSYVAALMAMRIAPVSLVAPAREVSVVFVALASWLIFREPSPVRRLIGAMVVLAGVMVLAF